MPSTSASMSNCRTASATERRKSPSPAFCSNSISGSLSSVIGPPHWSEWKLRNSTLERWSDGHLALHPHGHQISTTSTDATLALLKVPRLSLVEGVAHQVLREEKITAL